MAKELKDKQAAKKPEQAKKAGKEEEKKVYTEEQMKEVADKLAAEKDSYLRLMAEFDTFRRRSAEEKLAITASAASKTIEGLLPILDDCERGMALLGVTAEDSETNGVALIYRKLTDYLHTLGLKAIEAKGTAFDTDFHEAVTQFPTPDEALKGKVIDVVQTGYTLNGKILRYAKVIVGV